MLLNINMDFEKINCYKVNSFVKSEKVFKSTWFFNLNTNHNKIDDTIYYFYDS